MTLRFTEKRYSETDVSALYMKYREKQIGSFIREVGDFIAHKDRDRGATLERTVYAFSQLGFFQRYLGTSKVPLEFLGECPWWLRSWFLGKIDSEPMSKLKQISGFGKKELSKEVKTWFEKCRGYPINLTCLNPKLFYALAKYFSGTISGEVVFSRVSVRKEVTAMLLSEGIPCSELEPILIATSVLLHGKSIEVIKGFTASLSLTVDPQRIIHDQTRRTAQIYPDGNLKVLVSTQNNTGDGLVSVALDFLDTGIDTEKYFCRSMVKVNEHKLPRLELPKKLVFERNAKRMVFGV